MRASSPAGPLTPVSLLLLARLKEDPPGTGGVKVFGTGGAADALPKSGVDVFATTGADLSLVTVFLSLAPLVMSDNKAP